MTDGIKPGSIVYAPGCTTIVATGGSGGGRVNFVGLGATTMGDTVYVNHKPAPDCAYCGGLDCYLHGKCRNCGAPMMRK